MARPKLNITREQINLTIEREILKQIKKYANNKKKSLSQITEELYSSLLKDEKLTKENPELLMDKIKQAIPLIEKMIKDKENKKKLKPSNLNKEEASIKHIQN